MISMYWTCIQSVRARGYSHSLGVVSSIFFQYCPKPTPHLLCVHVESRNGFGWGVSVASDLHASVPNRSSPNWGETNAQP